MKFALLLAIALSACDSARKAGPGSEQAGVSDDARPRPTIDKLDLQSQLAPVNLDGRPGPDGVQVRLYLWRTADPLATLLERGTIEFLLFEGRVPPARLAATKPFHTWSYSAQELSRFAGKSAFGYGYALSLAWGDTAPRGGMLTVSARLLRPGAQPLYAEPLNLAVASK